MDELFNGCLSFFNKELYIFVLKSKQVEKYHGQWSQLTVPWKSPAVLSWRLGDSPLGAAHPQGRHGPSREWALEAGAARQMDTAGGLPHSWRTTYLAQTSVRVLCSVDTGLPPRPRVPMGNGGTHKH